MFCPVGRVVLHNAIRSVVVRVIVPSAELLQDICKGKGEVKASSSLGYGSDCLRRSPHSSSLLPSTSPLLSSSSSLSLFASYLFPSTSPVVSRCSSLSLFPSSLLPPSSSIRIPPSSFLLSTYRHSPTAVLSPPSVFHTFSSHLFPPTSSLFPFFLFQPPS